MKKVFKSVVALCSSLCIAMGVISCAKIKGKSKVENMVITIDVDGNQYDYNFDIYLNYAEGTVEHFKKLVEAGYYNNTIISNVSGHLEFGAYNLVDGKFASKDAEYNGIITQSYMADKYLYYGKDKNEMKDYPRYVNGKLVGEFATNGYVGNSLSFDGALVVKRDVDTDVSANAYNTGKGTMAVTFNNGDYYFTSSSEFAIIGMASKEDAKDDVKSSYDRLKSIITDYEIADNDNIYYYYTIGTAEYYTNLQAKLQEDFDNKEIAFLPEIKNYGHYFMFDAEEGSYRWDSNGDGTFDEILEDDGDVEGDAGEVIIRELADNSVYLNTIPYEGKIIKIVKITFTK